MDRRNNKVESLQKRQMSYEKKQRYKAMSEMTPSEHAKKFASYSPLPKPSFGHWICAADSRKPEDASACYVQFSGRSDIETFEHEQASAVYFADEGYVVNWCVNLTECTVEAWMPLAPQYVPRF